MILYLGLLAIQIGCIVDVIRNGRNSLWIMALIFLPVASAVAYLMVEVLPRLRHNRHIRSAREQVVERLDPEREVRAAREALSISKTTANRLRLADALAARGRHAEAISLYQDATGSGPPDFRTGEKLARSMYEVDRNQDALEILDRLATPKTASDRDRLTLLRATVLEGLGRDEEAAQTYKEVVDRYPGDEARCRYAALLIKLGRRGEARRILMDVEHRLKLLDRAQRAASAPMYDWAMKTLAELKG